MTCDLVSLSSNSTNWAHAVRVSHRLHSCTHKSEVTPWAEVSPWVRQAVPSVAWRQGHAGSGRLGDWGITESACFQYTKDTRDSPTERICPRAGQRPCRSPCSHLEPTSGTNTPGRFFLRLHSVASCPPTLCLNDKAISAELAPRRNKSWKWPQKLVLWSSGWTFPRVWEPRLVD